MTMASTVAEVAPWALEGTECWLLHRTVHAPTRPEKVTVEKVSKTRIAVVDAKGRTSVFTPAHDTLEQSPRAGTWQLNDRLVPLDDPSVPDLLAEVARRNTIARAQKACTVFSKHPTRTGASEAIDALAKLLAAYPDGDFHA